MFSYKQSIYDIEIQYIKNKIRCENKIICGERIENGKSVIIHPHKSLFDIKELRNKDVQLRKFHFLVNKIKDILELCFIEGTIVLISHYEYILINDDKLDNRSYDFLRLVLKKEKNIQILDLPLDDISENFANKVFELIHNSDLNNITPMKKYAEFVGVPHVLSSQAAGYFIHETIGHMLESDFFSYSNEMVRNLTISSKLKVVDSVKENRRIIGQFKYDDNGVATKPLTLICNGKVQNIISTENDISFDKNLYGCARRESYKTGSLPRMKNTFIVPVSNLQEKDIIGKYSRGIFVKEIYSAKVSYQTGNYFLQGNGYLIHNGILQNYIGNLKVKGNILKDMGKIDYIGDDLKIYGSYCVKMNQSVRVGCGGPTISILDLNSEGVVYGRV